MINVLLTFFLLLGSASAKNDHLSNEVNLGEKKFGIYYGARAPYLKQDLNSGKLEFEDELFYQKFFERFIFSDTSDYETFFKSEMENNLVCDNESFNESFEDIRYSYRLITLSYLLEGIWHQNMVAKNLFPRSCDFDFDKWLSSCQAKSKEMKRFTELLKKHRPKYLESLPANYSKKDWFKELKNKDFKYYSHYRIFEECKNDCDENKISEYFKSTCQNDQKLLGLICSEQDEIFGLSEAPMAYQLLLSSNIINTYNKRGNASGCLRRFSNILRNREVKYPVLKTLFAPIKKHLEAQYKERFIQGRVFFYGAGKEFEEKGLSNLHVMDQPLKILTLTDPEPPKIEPKPSPAVTSPSKSAPKSVIAVKKVEPKKVIEIRDVPKSAFYEASEARRSSNLNSIEVDMMKFKYDYVFSLNMIQNLSTRLNKFMTREALKEMLTYDHLGSKDAPVPLLFIKFMIDMQEHTGLFNITSIIGDTFYVSNEIDVKYKTVPEKIKLENLNHVSGGWQISVLKP